MTTLEKGETLHGEKNNRRHLKKLKAECRDLQFYICLTDKDNSSCIQTSSALYQIQNGQPKLIAYVRNRMPEAAKNYSITELEMCGLTINIARFVHLLKKVDFDMIIDHLAIMHTMKSKAEPATTHIKRLLELLSSYSFNLYYIKGKDMVLNNFLSRQKQMTANLMR